MPTSTSEHGDARLSALVVLRPAPGRELGDRGPVTAATIDEEIPDEQAVRTVQEAFRQRGFEVSAAVGASFSVAAPRSRFEDVFGARLSVEGTEVVRSVTTADGGFELPLDPLPPDVRGLVQAVTFTPPPDFGPTGYR